MESYEFTFEGMAVGYFLDSATPEAGGKYAYKAYRGPGHAGMQDALKASGAARCYHDTKAGRHFFDVIATPAEGEIEIANLRLAAMPVENLVKWLEPWVPAMPGAETELAKELGEGHALFGSVCVPIARRIDKDEILFQVKDRGDLYAVVHLTWSGKREKDATFPKTELFQGMDAWVAGRMKPDHETFMDPG